MRKIAHETGIDVVNGYAEVLLIATGILNTALMVTTICFVNDIEGSLREAYRVLTPTGRPVIGFIDRESFVGCAYEERELGNVFYSVANFYSTEELQHHLKSVGFSTFDLRQIIFHPLRKIRDVEAIKEGYGEGAFVVVAASRYQGNLSRLNGLERRPTRPPPIVPRVLRSG